MKKQVFVIVPQRAYGLDVIVPILYQLKEYYPNLAVTFIISERKVYDELNENVVLFEMVNTLGGVVNIFLDTQFEFYPRKIKELIKYIKMSPTIIKMLLSRKSIVFYPRKIQGLIHKIIVFLNSISGKTFCYLMASTSLKENLIQYFDENGERRPDVRGRSETIDVADGLIAYHSDNLEYLVRQGYKKNIIIGYPMMFTSFQNELRRLSNRYVQKEYQFELKDETIISVFVNKYFGRTSGQNDEWAKERFSETINAVRNIYPKSYILVRKHPMVPNSKIEFMIKELNVKNIKQTNLNVFTLGLLSFFVISISPSSSSLQALAVGTPSIDYGRIDDCFYKQFPSGSMYSDFGVQVAYTQKELENKIEQVEKNKKQWINIFNTELDHKMNFDVFFKYWS